MEQQANDYIRNREWKKASELYTTLLMTKNSNKDCTISYLQKRSECFFELGQHEAVVADCSAIVKLLANSKDGNDADNKNYARSRLVHALFCLQRYGDAETSLREWLTDSKNSEAPKLLEKLHVAMHSSQKKSLLDNKLSSLSNVKAEEFMPSCAYCHISCKDKAELRAHCQTEAHQLVIMSDEGRDWHWRPPPRGLNADSYTECKYWIEKSNCRFGAQCTEAHGKKELAEWKERFLYRQMKLQKAYEKELFGKSYTEQLLERCMQAINPKAIMCEQIDCVEDICDSNLVTTVLSKCSKKQWTFTLKTNKPLCAIALLHDMHRSYFYIIKIIMIINPSKVIELDVKNNQEWTLAVKQGVHENVVHYKVTVAFQTDIYGTFRQSVVFDFGYEPTLVKNMCVDVIPAEDVDKVDEIRREIALTVAERWTSANAEIIRFVAANPVGHSEDGWFEKLLQLYPCPHADALMLSHATITEKKLTANNYRSRMHELLFVEEMARNEQTNKYNLTAELHVVKSYILSSSNLASSTAKYSNFGELFAYMNLSQDLSEDTLCGRLILNNCTSVLMTLEKNQHEGGSKVYEALIEDKGKSIIYLRLSAMTVTELDLRPDNTYTAHIQFQLNRLPYCEWHYAIDCMSNLKLIFPDTHVEPCIPWSPQKQWCDCIDKRLNLKQKEAVIAITTPCNVPLPPILIIGPFGTGKTFTLAQAIKQLMKQEQVKILICTHSNSAADLYIKDYLDPYVKDGHVEARPLRIYYQKRWVTTVHPVVQEYCLIQESGGIRSFQTPTWEDIQKHKIVVITLSSSMYLSNMGLVQGYFTHILLDEAAQAIECEAIMPLSLANQNTRIVLAGDHMQLSPELFSKFAKERNLHVSLLERLYDHYPANFPCKILLCENYRAHEAIIEFTSELFYDQKLISSGKQPRHHFFYPLTFFTAKGEDVQDINSTAFYNSSEAYEIVERVHDLKKQWPKCWGEFDEHSIGIMTPYADQVFRIRRELRKRSMSSISVERVLNVQGKQFRAVFLSTVRTRRTCTSSSEENDYGFLSNSKLLNTAITRAQSLVAVIGDPVALCTIGRCSKVWERFIQICVQNKSLFGITWSFLKNQLDGLELKKTYGLNPLAPEFIPAKYKTEGYIKLPPQLSIRNGFLQPYAYSSSGPSSNFYVSKQPMPMVWPVYRQSNYLWGLPPLPSTSIVPNLPPVRPTQNRDLSLQTSQPQQQQQIQPTFVTPNIPVTRPTIINQLQQPAAVNQQQLPNPPERDLIQFLDNVHIPAGVKNNSDSLYDLINLLPEDMSLATVLTQPAAFHKQWFHYLLGKKGLEAAKKFEYLLMMSMKRERQNANDLNKKNIDWELLCADMLKNNISKERPAFCEVPQQEQYSPDFSWFDKPVNQINFDKPVYLKDPLHLDSFQQRSSHVLPPSSHRSTIGKNSFSNGITLSLDKRDSVPLYQRQSSVKNYPV